MKEKIIQINKRKKSKDFLIVIIFLVILFTTFIVSFSFAKYITVVNGKIFGNIAKPVIELRGEESFIITSTAPQTLYEFEVRNYDENDNINEVKMQYYIEIISDNNTILFQLYNGNEKIELESKKTKLINISKENKEVHKYRLNIIYNSSNLENIKDNIEIKIHSIQKI